MVLGRMTDTKVSVDKTVSTVLECRVTGRGNVDWAIKSSAMQLRIWLSSRKALGRERVNTQRGRHGVMMVVVVLEFIYIILQCKTKIGKKILTDASSIQIWYLTVTVGPCEDLLVLWMYVCMRCNIWWPRRCRRNGHDTENAEIENDCVMGTWVKSTLTHNSDSRHTPPRTGCGACPQTTHRGGRQVRDDCGRGRHRRKWWKPVNRSQASVINGSEGYVEKGI